MVSVDEGSAGNGFITELQATLKPFREGVCPVVINYQRQGARVELPLGNDWTVHPTDELLHRLRELTGEEQIHIVY